MSNPRIVFSLAAIAAVLALAPARAQTKPTALDGRETPGSAAESSLVVGALQIGSAANLEVEGIDINVASDSILYSYFFKNTGSTALDLTAAVTLPELQASADGSETWVLASNDPENPVGLTITAAGAPVTTKAEIHAYALGLDSLAEIRAEHLPLIPFGPQVDEALAALSPQAADRLAARGIVSPPDPAEPKAPPKPDWSLDVARGWRQSLPPSKTTEVVVKFAPIKARYRMAKGDQQDLGDMKDDLCLRQSTLNSLQSRLKAGGVLNVIDMSLAVDPPAHWIDSPKPTFSVRKPRSDAIVAFCGMDEKTASRPTVLGVAPDDSNEVRIVIFEPAGR